MPTNLASNATAPRMRSASAASVSSASGSATMVVFRVLVEPRLQDYLRGHRVARCLARSAAHAGVTEARIGRTRGEPLIHARHRQAKAVFERASEAFRARGHLVLRSVRMQRTPDDQRFRLPFGDQRLNRFEARGLR